MNWIFRSRGRKRFYAGRGRLHGLSAVLILCVIIGSLCFPWRAEGAGPRLSGNYSILLIGSDRRDGSWNGNSDTMILITINHDMRKIFMVSFMRDLYADIPGTGVRKLNSAYAIGGAKLLIETLGANYGVRVDNYVASDFDTTARIIDSLGGVDLELTQAEADIVGTQAGPVHLNGAQAVAYSRIRYVGNADFERTERQRRILSYLYNHLDKSDAGAVLGLAENILGMLDHNLTTVSLMQLALMIPAVSGYELVQERVPFDGTFTISNEILIPNDLSETRNRLTAMIYETKPVPKEFHIDVWFMDLLRAYRGYMERIMPAAAGGEEE